MSKVRRKIVDEHENMEPVFLKKKVSVLASLVLLCVVTIVAFIAVNIMRRDRERKRIDEIVSSIQNEIYLKQCHLDKMYCCGYKDKDACEKWHRENCSEEDGSLEINCNIKF